MNLMDIHKAILNSKDKLRFHLVRRLEMGTNRTVTPVGATIIHARTQIFKVGINLGHHVHE
jgi:hypothetical protein